MDIKSVYESKEGDNNVVVGDLDEVVNDFGDSLWTLICVVVVNVVVIIV